MVVLHCFGSLPKQLFGVFSSQVYSLTTLWLKIICSGNLFIFTILGIFFSINFKKNSPLIKVLNPKPKLLKGSTGISGNSLDLMISWDSKGLSVDICDRHSQWGYAGINYNTTSCWFQEAYLVCWGKSLHFIFFLLNQSRGLDGSNFSTS